MADDKRQQDDADETLPKGNGLADASEEAVREMKQRAEGTGHAGAGDIG